MYMGLLLFHWTSGWGDGSARVHTAILVLGFLLGWLQYLENASITTNELCIHIFKGNIYILYILCFTVHNSIRIPVLYKLHGSIHITYHCVISDVCEIIWTVVSTRPVSVQLKYI